MRFFKYLVLIFLSIISVDALAAWKSFNKGSNSYVYPTALQACSAAYSNNSNYSYRVEEYDTWAKCFVKMNNLEYNDGNVFSDGKKVCPAKGWPLPVYLPLGTTRIPIRMCKDGCSIEGSGLAVEGNNYVMTPMSFTGDDVDCNERYKDDPIKCDTKDPYGECYIPPNDGCVRLKDGSITCPSNQSPPPDNETCNGATYCKRPPEGCGEGYVSGSFNGQQLCVRSGPNDPSNPPEPDQPDDPNNCMNGGSYCPQPPNNSSCPSGYYETTYNGSKICVRNNPDPDQPNPNDPNNSNGGDNGGGDGDGNGDGDGDTGGTGETGSIDFKPIIDAIKSLKDSLLAAISGISTKLTTLINGQKTTNDHLEKIEDSTGEIRDFLKDESKPSERDTKAPVDVVAVPEPTNQQYLGWSPSCPMQAKSNQLVINGIATTLDSDFTPTCEMALAVRPFVLAAGAIIAFLIASGVWMGRGEN